jgi:pyroglutamyl-peptidase
MKILVTGFKPFLGEAINPSEMLALELSQSEENVESLILPVEFQNSFKFLKSNLDQNDLPDFLIMIGQASGRKNMCFEKMGLNWVQTNHRDEAGFQPKTGTINPDGALALTSQFPIDEAYLHLRQQNLPVEISFSAGAFVCNDLYYRVLSEYKNLKAVFIHVPLLPEQLKVNDDRSSLSFEKQTEVLRALHHLTSIQTRPKV